ncbi:hypothetical protein DV738_g1036, partial [Chaetothyriales sp. CBS 135597]
MATAISDKFYAIVAGVGPGTGRSVALRFAQHYPVVLLARRPESYNEVVAQINKAGGRAIGIATDATDQASLAAAFETINKEWQGLQLAAAIYNVRTYGRSSRKPFLELKVEDLESNLKSTLTGLFTFAQVVVPLLQKSVDSSPNPPTLIVTGATASLRGSKQWAAIAPAKSAARILTQSLAREFGPTGIHVAHAVIDGGIDIAESYWSLHTQHKSGFTQEIDLRPFNEHF